MAKQKHKAMKRFSGRVHLAATVADSPWDSSCLCQRVVHVKPGTKEVKGKEDLCALMKGAVVVTTKKSRQAAFDAARLAVNEAIRDMGQHRINPMWAMYDYDLTIPALIRSLNGEGQEVN